MYHQFYSKNTAV